MSTYQLNKAVYEFGKIENRTSTAASKERFLSAYSLDQEERAALMKPDFAALRRLGLLPNLLFRYYIYHDLPVSEFRTRMQYPDERSKSGD